jgi:hypothetical protein
MMFQSVSSKLRFKATFLLVTLLVANFACLTPAAAVAADAMSSWAVLSTRQKLNSRATLRALGSFSTDAEWTFLVVHGLGGTTTGDRFETLCEVLKREHPQANVVLVDWTPDATEKFWGVYNLSAVTRNIDIVAADAAAILKEQKISTKTTTAIGESFGVYVAGRVGLELGEIEHILAFNTASELGGYTPIDLRKVARRSCSFQTYSPFDTLRPVAHVDLFLETPTGASHSAQHTFGIAWLIQRLRANDPTWLRLSKEVTPRESREDFDGRASLDGELQLVAIPRARPENELPEAEQPAPEPAEDLTIASSR